MFGSLFMKTHENAINAQGYVASLQTAIESLDFQITTRIAYALIDLHRLGKQIFLIGNGGSASIIEHFYCDLIKTVSHNVSKIDFDWAPNLRTLTGPSSLTFALSNDLSFDSIFSWQIEKYVNHGDCLLAVSSSGNSENILAAAKVAKNKGAMLIGFCGFTEPALKDLADLCVHIPSSNYGIVEDVHSIVLHSIVQEIISIINVKI
jgi:D-sedoheptulose 7-phosphate isomerase